MPGGARPAHENIEFASRFARDSALRGVNLKMPGVNLKMPGGARPKRENIEFVLFFYKGFSLLGG